MALAMVAAQTIAVKSAPAAKNTDGGESLYIHPPNSFDFFDEFQFSRFPRLRDLVPPIEKSKNSEQAAPEQTHHKQATYLYFSGSDVFMRYWAFSHLGMIWSPGGLDSEGLTFKVLTSGGLYSYRSSTLNDSIIIGRQYAATIQPGWRFKRNGFEVTIFGGLDYQIFQTYPNDPGASLRGIHTGLRATVEVWHEPTSTTMFAADASMSSIGAGNYARLAYGWQVFERFYLGPEIQAYTAQNFRHLRFGAHLTASKYYEHEWFAAAGMSEDSDKRSGLYLRIGYLTRR